MTRVICLHGPESVGKSTMATLLAEHLGSEIVPEFGRAYCEEHGTDTSMHDLVVIAERQRAMGTAARKRAGDWLILDTDPVMTAAWAQMMHGRQDSWFARFDDYADVYLLMNIELPWVDDGLRIYGEPADRQRFFDLCKAELDTRGVKWALVSGDGEDRFDHAMKAIERAFV
jgi:NadR type nicotinamide-nucleotide adenylyltransferase